MKDCFGKTVTSLKKAEECRTCPEFELCTQMMWQELPLEETAELTGDPVPRREPSAPVS
jgi:hypothetical protein